MEQNSQTASYEKRPSPPARRSVSSLDGEVERLKNHIGKTEEGADLICAAPVAGLAATLDRATAPGLGDRLPPLWHWLFFRPVTRQSDLGEEGHTGRGGFLPPMPLPRRMWAGGRVRFLRPLQIGEQAVRTSRIGAIDLKQGRTGPLLFATVGHEFRNSCGAMVIREEQDFVFREAATTAVAGRSSVQAPESPLWTQEIVPSSMMLFRYSALTFNSHRIHYDRPYATGVEGYPGLVVHGPLLATLLLELLRKNLPQAQIDTFSYRAVAPLFDTGPIVLCGRQDVASSQVSLWAQAPEGRLAMTATATLTPTGEAI